MFNLLLMPSFKYEKLELITEISLRMIILEEIYFPDKLSNIAIDFLWYTNLHLVTLMSFSPTFLKTWFENALVWHWVQNLYCYHLQWSLYILNSLQINFLSKKMLVIGIKFVSNPGLNHMLQYYIALSCNMY